MWHRSCQKVSTKEGVSMMLIARIQHMMAIYHVNMYCYVKNTLLHEKVKKLKTTKLQRSMSNTITFPYKEISSWHFIHQFQQQIFQTKRFYPIQSSQISMTVLYSTSFKQSRWHVNFTRYPSHWFILIANDASFFRKLIAFFCYLFKQKVKQNKDLVKFASRPHF